MRRLIPLFALLVAAGALAQAENPYTVEARGEKYSVAIDVHPGDRARYDVRITDLSTNAVVWQPHLAGNGLQLDITEDKDGLHFSCSVRKRPNALDVRLVVENQSTVIDSLDAGWHGPSHELQMNASRASLVGGNVKAPVIISRVEPLYPEVARRNGVVGIVIVETHIDKSGVVRDAMVVKEVPDGLSEAALDAVKQWRFKPATMNGEPVDVIFNLTVNFKLDSKPASR